jgi:hypothetical protein
MSTRPAPELDQGMTEAEYRAFEAATETKHDFIDGHVYDWSGDEYAAQ